MVEVLRPGTLAEALAFRKETAALPFAGGTDVMVRERGYTGTGPRIDRPVLFLDAVGELRSITLGDFAAGAILSIGAAATLTEIVNDERVPEPLRESCRLIAAPGLRNRATMAGNICNASPAGDSIPPLYVLDARVVLAREGEVRTVPIAEFLTGPGRTTLRDDEIMIAIQVPLDGDAAGDGAASADDVSAGASDEGSAAAGGSAASNGSTTSDGKTPRTVRYYRKVGTRRANALSKLSGAGIARIDGRGVVTDFRLALGAVGPVVVRVPAAERLVAGQRASEIEPEPIVAAYTPHIRPITDQRSTAEYRSHVARNLVREFISRIQET